MYLLIKRASPHKAWGEGDPTVSHPGRDAVCLEPRREDLWISHSSFCDLVRSLGCFSPASYIAPLLALTTPVDYS